MCLTLPPRSQYGSAIFVEGGTNYQHIRPANHPHLSLVLDEVDFVDNDCTDCVGTSPSSVASTLYVGILGGVVVYTTLCRHTLHLRILGCRIYVQTMGGVCIL